MPSPQRRPSRAVAALLIGMVLGFVFLVVGVGIALDDEFDRVSVDWHPDPAPTDAQLAALRTTPGSTPAYWFGRSFNGAALSTATRAGTKLSFDYGVFCQEYDPGSGLTCTDKARVESRPRGGDESALGTRRACWQAFGDAWVHACSGSTVARLFTGDQVVRPFIPSATDQEFSKPWRQVVAQLERFDAAGTPVYPAATRFTCTEARRLGPAQRRALPAALRPRSCG
jgi:hypothetical protein